MQVLPVKMKLKLDAAEISSSPFSGLMAVLPIGMISVGDKILSDKGKQNDDDDDVADLAAGFIPTFSSSDGWHPINKIKANKMAILL